MEMLMVGEKPTSEDLHKCKPCTSFQLYVLELQTSVSFHMKDLVMDLRWSGSPADDQVHWWNVQNNFIRFLQERYH